MGIHQINAHDIIDLISEDSTLLSKKDIFYII